MHSALSGYDSGCKGDVNVPLAFEKFPPHETYAVNPHERKIILSLHFSHMLKDLPSGVVDVVGSAVVVDGSGFTHEPVLQTCCSSEEPRQVSRSFKAC